MSKENFFEDSIIDEHGCDEGGHYVNAEADAEYSEFLKNWIRDEEMLKNTGEIK
jgi:hypothetical protein